ncbi:MAG: hypothetical protein AAF850_01205 [Pseudomonadota bacterium]
MPNAAPDPFAPPVLAHDPHAPPENDARVKSIAEAFLARTLPKAAWTHEAHFVTTVYILRARPDIDAHREMPSLIKNYNVAAGGKNTDTEGYHETLTRFYLALVRDFIKRRIEHQRKDGAEGETLAETCAALLNDERSARDYALRFYSRAHLFSVKARKEFVAPDLSAPPFPL